MSLRFSYCSIKVYIFLSLLCFVYATPLKVFAAVEQKVMGAGPSTQVVKLFFDQFSSLAIANEYKFIVAPRSIKHAGGIKASERYFFGRTGRPLNIKEKALNKKDLFLARIPLSFVVGKKVGITHLTRDQLESIYARKVRNWKELGGANANIILAGRETTEAALSVIQVELPIINQTKFDLVLTRDHQVVNLISSVKGDFVISFGARSNFDDSNLLHIDGFEAGVNLGLVFDTKNENHKLIEAAINYANSKEWHKLVRKHGLLPPTQRYKKI